MPVGNVDWFSFDPETGAFPDQVEPSLLPESGRGRIVALAAAPSSESNLWAGWTAVALAGEWASKGLRIFLMDLGLETPVLHKILNVENDEGVSDAFLYGASIQRIARPALEGAIFFAPAGTASGDPEEVLGHSRWEDLVGGFSEADATLLLYLPTEISGAEKILGLASDIIFLGREGEDPSAYLGPAAAKVLAAVGPPEEPTGAEAPPFADSVEDVDTSIEAEDLTLDLPESASLAPGFEESLGLSLPLEADVGLETGPPSASLDTQVDPVSAGGESHLPAGEDLVGTEDLFVERGLQDSPPEYPDEVVLADGPPEELSGEGEESDLEVSSEFSAAFQARLSGEGLDPAPELLPGSDLGLEMEILDADPGTGSDPQRPAEVVSLQQEPASELAPRDRPPLSRPPRSPSTRRPPLTRRPRAASSRRATTRARLPWNRIGLLVVILGAVTAVAGAVTGLLTLPGVAVFQGALSGLPDPALTLEGRQAFGPVMGYSLQLFSYDREELEDAREMKIALEARLPEITFFISPVGGERRTPYLLLAGPAENRSQAEALRSPLSQVLDREDPYSWTVRETPRAFFLGERSTLEDAKALEASLEVGEIDPYVLEVSYPDGSAAFRVLAGAFSTVGESRILQRFLSMQGIENPPLIERTGRRKE